MKIYAITKGDYSDYHIIALTADKERAETLKKIYDDEWNVARIEEYEDGYKNMDDVYYGVCINCYRGEETIHVGVDEYSSGIRPFKKSWTDKRDKEHCQYSAVIQTNSEGKARKIAQDMWAQYKAEKLNIC